MEEEEGKERKKNTKQFCDIPCLHSNPPPPLVLLIHFPYRRLMNLITLHIKDSTETEITVHEPVSSAIHVTGCQSCNLKASGQQLRLHDSTNLTCEVNIGAGAILEDCSGLVFATTKESIDVRDFNWLRSGEPSPNYEIRYIEMERKEEVPSSNGNNSEGTGQNDTDSAGVGHPALDGRVTTETASNETSRQQDVPPTPVLKNKEDVSDNDNGEDDNDDDDDDDEL